MNSKSQVSNSKFENSPLRRVSISALRILLWDIDGTLMSSVRSGAFKVYFATIMKKVFGTIGGLEDLPVSGMTDFQIIYESLKDEGFTVEDVRAKVPEFLKILPVEMRRFVAAHKTHFLLGGVKEILQATSENPRYINALLTGNFLPSARIKLEMFGLQKYFDFSLSAFGEVSHKRSDLGSAVIKNANKKFGYKFQPVQFIVIGDTPNDIACARVFGAKMISVATGRGHPKEELLTYKPDVLLENLEDTENILQVFESL